MSALIRIDSYPPGSTIYVNASRILKVEPCTGFWNGRRIASIRMDNGEAYQSFNEPEEISEKMAKADVEATVKRVLADKRKVKP